MLLYTRGPVCGVNNCPSRLWRQLEGHKVCQYGHILESDFLYEDEPGDYQSNVLRNSQFSAHSQAHREHLEQLEMEKQDSVLWGMQGKCQFLKCYQYILKAQISWLRTNRDAPPSLQKVVKKLWTLYLEGESAEDRTWEDTGDSITKQRVMNVRNKRHKTVNGQLFSIPIIHSVILCYIGCLLINFPLYANDFIRFCLANQLPYMKTLREIPDEMKKRLPPEYIPSLEATFLPSNGEFYHAFSVVAARLALFEHGNSISLFSLMESFEKRLSINPQLLLIKIVKEFLLPKEVIIMTLNLIQECQLSFSWTNEKNHALRSPEVRLVSILISIVKIYFLAPNYTDQDLLVSNWRTWTKALHRKKLRFRNTLDNDDLFVDLVNYISMNSYSIEQKDLLKNAFGFDLNDIAEGSEKDYPGLDRYLRWFDDSPFYTEKPREKRTIPERRLLEIFNFDHSESSGNDDDKEVEVFNDYIPVQEVGVVSLQHILRIERILVDELSINLGLSSLALRACVNLWSDQLVLKWLKSFG